MLKPASSTNRGMAESRSDSNENDVTTLRERKIQVENVSGFPMEKKRKLLFSDDNYKPATKSNDHRSLSLLSLRKEGEDADRQEQWDESRLPNSEVEALLNMKMTKSSKYDVKGKTGQMMDYIKKLRDCIHQFLLAETQHDHDLNQLNHELQEQQRKHEQAVFDINLERRKLEEEFVQLKQRSYTLEGELETANAEKENLLIMHEKDLRAIQTAEDEKPRLAIEIDKLKHEVSMSNEQVKSLNDNNKLLAEYNVNLQSYNNKLQRDAANAAEQNMQTKQEKACIMETLKTVQCDAVALQAQIEKTKESALEGIKQRASLIERLERVRAELQCTLEERTHCRGQIQALKEGNARFRDCTGKSECEIEILTRKAIALEESYLHQREEINSLHQQLDIANEKLQMANASLAHLKREETGCKSKIEALQCRLTESEHQLHEGELLRRKLHNTIQELKGNIRVFCRVRPMLPDDDWSLSDYPVVQYPTSTDSEAHNIELVQPQHGQKYTFSFDKVFGPEITQEDVFVDISQLVQSALDGYKVCIFAYGQTGSGKTYTMLGQPEDSHHKGLIPRSLEQIFTSSLTLHAQGWNFKMQASMLEIYNESIRDLLASHRPNSHDTGRQHVVKHDVNGNTFISDLTIVEVKTWEEVSSLLKQAAQSRHVGRTAMNEQSSRSHCVFSLRISGLNENTEQRVHGVLNLIDLAGSERLSRSGATGERLKETQAINKSLSSLGDVIMAIANKEQHIPYRNSKLTYLLQPCLGGDSKTLMFVNISPDPKSFGESLCSLRFASKVNTCQIGVPRRQTHSRVL